MGGDGEADIVGGFVDALEVHPALQLDDLLRGVDAEHILLFVGRIAHDDTLVEPADGVVFDVGQQVVCHE